MKRLLMVLGVLALLAGVLTVTLATTVGAQGPGPQPLTLVVVVDFDPPFSSICVTPFPCLTSQLGKGVRTVQVWVLKDTEGNTIGKYTFDAVSTEDIGTQGWYGHDSFTIDGEGVIEGISHGTPWLGAIIGGTGKFAGVSGEYSGSGATVTFTFERPPR